MPQFDISFYLSQAFWMMVSFGFLFLMMNFWVCPMIEKVLSERHRLIQDNLDRADEMNNRAEKLIQQYHSFVFQAEQEKNSKIQEGYAAILKVASEKESNNEKTLQESIQKAKENIASANEMLARKSEEIADQISDELGQHFLGKGN